MTPDPRLLTMRIHHSFLRAPTGYTPRAADPRIGVSAIRFQDYSKPFSDGPEESWITRWRLEKKNPTAPLSDPVKPITIYFDPAIPAPIRHTMKQGLLWWNKAYEAAGFSNAIVALDAPADMDPMDIRYSYVLWIKPRRARLFQRRHLSRSAHRRDHRIQGADGHPPHPHRRQLLGHL